jgi:O-antigen/teichoic acid export membrane protein
MELVGVYNVGLLMYMYALKLIISCSGVFQPRLAALAGIDRKQFNRAVMRYSIFLSNFTVAVGITGYLLCGDFLKLWMPGNFGDTSTAAYVFYILLASLMPNLMTDVSVSALQAVKKHKYIAYQTVSEGVVNLALSIWLVGKFGIVGVAIAAAVPAVIVRVIIQPVYCCKILGIKWSVYMRQIIVTPLLVFGLMAMFASLGGVLPAAVTYSQLILKGAVVFGAYILIAFYVCIDGQMRQEVFARLSRIYLGVSGIVLGKGLVGSDNSDG